MPLVRPEVVLEVEDVHLNPLGLHEAFAAIGFVVLNTAVGYVALLNDVAVEETAFKYVFPTAVGSIVAGSEGIFVGQYLTGAGVVYPEHWAFGDYVAVLVQFVDHGCDAQDAHLHGRALLIEEPNLLKAVAADIVRVKLTRNEGVGDFVSVARARCASARGYQPHGCFRTPGCGVRF